MKDDCPECPEEENLELLPIIKKLLNEGLENPIDNDNECDDNKLCDLSGTPEKKRRNRSKLTEEELKTTRGEREAKEKERKERILKIQKEELKKRGYRGL